MVAPGVVAWLLAAAAAVAAGQDDQQVEKAEQILNASCASCHDLRPIQVQASDRDGWARIVDSMIEKGAKLDKDKDLPLLLDYLSTNYGPLPEGAGKTILLNNCTLCHDLRRVKLHGGTRDDWEDTLETMLNEGASLTDEEFPALLNYLARNFKP